MYLQRCAKVIVNITRRPMLTSRAGLSNFARKSMSTLSESSRDKSKDSPMLCRPEIFPLWAVTLAALATVAATERGKKF